jgi:hypothetical protein
VAGTTATVPSKGARLLGAAAARHGGHVASWRRPSPQIREWSMLSNHNIIRIVTFISKNKVGCGMSFVINLHLILLISVRRLM